jgi:ABC-type proline/glycine betaine transport system permease subunit
VGAEWRLLGGCFVTSYEPFSGLQRPTLKTWEDAMNNSSMLTADRGTHLKIVVVSLICATIVAGIGIAARVNVPNGGREATVITVGKPVTAQTNDGTSIR